MDPLLKKDRDDIKEILRHTLKVAEQYLAQQETMPPGKYVPDIAPVILPQKGIGARETIDFFEKNYGHEITNSAGPRYFGFVTGGSTPASLAGDWLVSAYDQNACGINDSIAPQIEKQTIGFFKQLFGLPAEYYGSFVTGATMSNFVGLALGRQWVGDQHGVDCSSDGLTFPLKVISATPHSSILKSLSMLGVGRNALVRIETIADREAVDVNSLENFLLLNEEPVIVVANAGTVNTGDFDNLLAIGKLKEKYKFWLHVDAAFGGFVACSEIYSHLTAGIQHADSITIDAHKWMNVPYDAAMQFTRYQALQLKVFQNSAAYLGDPEKSADYFHYTPENSRRWRALPSWFSIIAYGKDGVREIVERNCLLAQQLGAMISRDDDFILLSQVRLNIVCFTIKRANVTMEVIHHYLRVIRDDGRVYFTPTVYKGAPAIRAAISNWQTQVKDIEIAYEVLRRVHHLNINKENNHKFPADKSI